MGSENGGELRGWGRVAEAGREGTKRLPNGQYIPTPLVHRTNPDFRRAVDTLPHHIKEEAINWPWIGPHDDYDALLDDLRAHLT